MYWTIIPSYIAIIFFSLYQHKRLTERRKLPSRYRNNRKSGNRHQANQNRRHIIYVQQ